MALPIPLNPWARVAITLGLASFAAGAAVFEYLDEAGSADELAWLHVTAHAWRSTPTGTSEDRAQIGFDFAKLSAGGNDPTWDAAQIDPVLDSLTLLLGDLAVYMDNNAYWQELRAYVKKFRDVGPGIAPSGDPVEVRTMSIGGVSAGTVVLPYQVAASVTEKTAMRKHWGRFYIPCPSSQYTDGFGRFTSSLTQGLSTAVAARYEALANLNYVAVVPSAATRTLFSVTQIQVDDVPDVIRRRRPRTTLIRSVHPA